MNKTKDPIRAPGHSKAISSVKFAPVTWRCKKIPKKYGKPMEKPRRIIYGG